MGAAASFNLKSKMSSMEALRPTKQIVSVLRKHGRMNRRALWEHLVEEQTTIRSKLHAKDLLRWLVQKNRVQIHLVTKEQARDQAKSKRWEYEVNEFNEQKAESKLKPKYAYPNAKQQQQYRERKEKAELH